MALSGNTGTIDFGNARVDVSGGAAHVSLYDSAPDIQGTAAGGTIALSTASQQTAAIAETAVLVSADTDCFIEIGSNPTAALNTSMRIPANADPFPLKITSGNKIAVISAGATGNFFYHPVA